MLSIKNQKYIFGRLLKGEFVAYQPLDEDRLVFSDGVRLFVLSKEQIKFDATKCAYATNLKDVLHNALNGTEVRATEEIRDVGRSSKTYRKLTANGISNSVWVEDKFVKDYGGCILLYNSLYKKKPVCALDDYGELLAAIMPFDMNAISERE